MEADDTVPREAYGNVCDNFRLLRRKQPPSAADPHAPISTRIAHFRRDAAWTPPRRRCAAAAPPPRRRRDAAATPPPRRYDALKQQHADLLWSQDVAATLAAREGLPAALPAPDATLYEDARRVGDVELLDVLGRGAFAGVWEGRWRETRRPCAVKRMVKTETRGAREPPRGNQAPGPQRISPKVSPRCSGAHTLYAAHKGNEGMKA